MKARFLAGMAAVVCAVATVVPAQAVSAQQPAFSIPAGDLKSALDAYVRQSGIQLIYRTDQVRGIRSPGVSGDVSADVALASLLAGTGLTARKDASGAFAIVSAEGNVPNVDVAATDQGDVGRFGNSSDDEAIVVTGSRLRQQPNGPSPVIKLDQGELRNTGQGTVARALATLPQNFGAESDTRFSNLDGSTANFSFGSGVNLRGLGVDSTLVLIDGHRLPSSGVEATYTDISSIPLSAVDRVEVLLDGASAIYGADAIGGVVNIILKKQYRGLELGTRGGISTRKGYHEYAFDVSGGLSWAGGRLIASAEYYRQSELNINERMNLVGTGDFTARGGSNFIRNDITSPANLRAADGFLNQIGVATSAANLIGVPLGQDGTSLTPADFLPVRRNTLYSFVGASLLPQQTRLHGYLLVQQDLGDHWKIAFSGLAARHDVDAFSPVPVATPITIPAGKAFNPFNETVILNYRPVKEFGGAPRAARTKTYALNLSLTGDVGAWQLQASAGIGADDVHHRIDIRDAIAIADNIAQSIPGQTFNFFGDGSANSRELAKSLFSLGQFFDGKSTVKTAEIGAEGPLIQLPGGEVRLAIGSQYRSETFSSHSFTLKGLVVGGAPINTRRQGDRKSLAFYSEVLVPIFGKDNAVPFIRRLELTGALRHERFNDFGTATTPKIGMVWEPLERLLFRASWGKSFKAPRLRDINSPVAVFNSTLSDPRRGNERISFPQTTGGNPDLGPEKAETLSLGAVFRPFWPERLLISLNYYKINYNDRVLTPGLTTVIFQEEAFPGVITRAASCPVDAFAPFCPIIAVDLRPRNFAVVKTSGWDITATYPIRLAGGTLQLSGNVNYIEKFNTQFSPDTAVVKARNTVNNPLSFRARGGMAYTRSQWEMGVVFNHWGRYHEGQVGTLAGGRKIDPYTTADAYITYDGTKNSFLEGFSLALRMLNVTDAKPPFVNTPFAFDSQVYDPRGRLAVAELRKRF